MQWDCPFIKGKGIQSARPDPHQPPSKLALVVMVTVVMMMPRGIRRNHRTSQNGKRDDSKKNTTQLHVTLLEIQPLALRKVMPMPAA